MHYMNDSNSGNSGNRKSTSEQLPAKFRSSSKFDPMVQSTMLEAFERVVTQEVTKGWDSIRKPPSNFTRRERMALKELCQDKSIVAKKADKEGATVIMDKAKYITEAQTQLADPQVYRLLKSDPHG